MVKKWGNIRILRRSLCPAPMCGCIFICKNNVHFSDKFWVCYYNKDILFFFLLFKVYMLILINNLLVPCTRSPHFTLLKCLTKFIYFPAQQWLWNPYIDIYIDLLSINLSFCRYFCIMFTIRSVILKSILH